MSEPARLFRVEEVTEPGMLPAGLYLITCGMRVLVETELLEPMHPRDLRDEIIPMLKASAEGGDDE